LVSKVKEDKKGYLLVLGAGTSDFGGDSVFVFVFDMFLIPLGILTLRKLTGWGM